MFMSVCMSVCVRVCMFVRVSTSCQKIQLKQFFLFVFDGG